MADTTPKPPTSPSPKPPSPSPAPRPTPPSQPVGPMTTDDMPTPPRHG